VARSDLIPGAAVPEVPETGALERSAIQGGIYLALREGIGIGIRLGGILLLTLEIGPTSYGIYVTAAGITAVVALVAQMGAEVFLIRQNKEPDDSTYHQVATTLFIWTAVVLAVSLLLTHFLHFILPEHRLLLPLRVLLISLPVNVLWAPAQAKIERAFRYRAMGLLELSGDFTLYAVSVTLAFLGFGLWAPVIGYIAWQSVLLLGSWVVAGMRPTWAWNRQTSTDVARFGSAYTSSTIFGSFLALINPIVVGRYMGPRIVGQIALGLRLVDAMSFIGRATWRLSLVLFGKVSNDLNRLQAVLSKVMSIQVLLLAPLYAGISLLAPVFIGGAFGDKWKLASTVFPYLATRALFNGVTLALVTVGYALDKHNTNVRAAIVSLVAQATTAMLLVPHIGTTGYALSEIASLSGVIVLHLELRRVVHINYLDVLPWLCGSVPILFFPITDSVFRWLLFAPLVVVLMIPAARRQLFGMLAAARETAVRRNKAPEPLVDELAPAGRAAL
jgi:O-antigen/teichoic acid export membrane protein